MNSISNIFNIGLSSNMTLTEKRSIRFTNFSLVAGLTFCILSFFINVAFMGWLGGIPPSIFFVLFGIGFIFQWKHQLHIAKFFVLSIAIFGIMFSCWLFSLKGFPYFLFLLTISMGIVLYPAKKQQILLFLTHLICLGITLVLAPYIPSVLEIPSPRIFGILTFLLVMFLLFIVIRTFTNENQIFEDKTNELVDFLQEQKTQIEKQAMALQNSNERLQEEIAKKTIIQEQLKISNEELKRFVYIASHDLKEPLRTIGGFTQLIHRELKEQMDDTTTQYFDFVTGGVKRMGILLDDLLAYSKVTKKELIEKGPLDLNKIIDSIQSSLYNLIERNKGQIIVKQKLPTVYGNSTQITQLFQNFMSNAVKFKGKDSPLVYIDFEEKEAEFIFSIQDNGIGIPKNQQNKIFGAFQRLHNSEYEGTGIGLAICEKVVVNHRGKIWLESEEGKGTTFYFSIAKEENKESKQEEPILAFESSI